MSYLLNNSERWKFGDYDTIKTSIFFKKKKLYMLFYLQADFFDNRFMDSLIKLFDCGSVIAGIVFFFFLNLLFVFILSYMLPEMV